ncbi:MAG: glucan 1,4-alpha-glucosidase [Gemmatimonadota bacterium]
MTDASSHAPGHPGIPARWTSSAKSGVGTALSDASRVWFTISHGILNEIYFPDVDVACTRDLGLVVTDDHGFLSEEKRNASHEVDWLASGIPAFRFTNSCASGRYRIEKTIFAASDHHTVLQHTRFVPLVGTLDDYHVHVICSPHLGNQGAGNTAWVGQYKRAEGLFAERADYAMAVMANVPWRTRSVGFVGTSDAWQDLSANGRMTWEYQRAEDGNVAMAGELDLRASNGEFVIAIGFGHDHPKAAHHALAALLVSHDTVLSRYAAEWSEWQQQLIPLDDDDPTTDLFRQSAAVIRTHQSKSFFGGTIASLSIPWGFAKGDGDLGGYHLVWPRDLVNTATGLLAAGAPGEARRVLYYLHAVQEVDGHWAQNCWLDGTTYWLGIQMDETALPILLVDLARRERALSGEELSGFWPMVRLAAAFLVRNGPATTQDRWEENSGFSPYTLATEVAALLAAADLADGAGEAGIAHYLRETADSWNDCIERWTYVRGTAIATACGVDGYYVRIAPLDTPERGGVGTSTIEIRNQSADRASAETAAVVSPDALALVRFGLRRADDPRIVNTVKVIDAELKTEFPVGPAWRRYRQDGYGEHADGGPFDGTGIGRPWPLLTGERAAYELSAGRRSEAERLTRTMAGFANYGGLLPEQVWDGPDSEAQELCFGKPAGSAMPLVWAHAEYVRMLRSLRDGVVFATPPQTVARYGHGTAPAVHFPWSFSLNASTMPSGRVLRITLLHAATIRWSRDAWQSWQDTPTTDPGLGSHVADLDVASLPDEAQVVFTIRWHDANRWEGRNFTLRVEAAAHGVSQAVGSSS